MNTALLRLTATAVVLSATVAPCDDGDDGDGGKRFREVVAPFFQKYCFRCHGEKRQRAKLNLAAHMDPASVTKERKTWGKVLRLLLDHEMPPEKSRQPPAVERADVAKWIHAELQNFNCDDFVDPGRVTLHRLNRAEYRNTIRDLMGVDFVAAKDFPADEVGYGFDNIGDNLSLPPLLMEKYLDAAEGIVAAVIEKEKVGEELARYEGRRVQAEKLEATTEVQSFGNWGLSLNKDGEVYTTYEFAETGEYLLRARACAQQAGAEKARMAFRIDGKEIKALSVAAEDDAPEIYEVRATVEAGKRRFSIAYLNNYYEPDHPNPRLRGDRNLIVDWFEARFVRSKGNRAASTGSAARRVYSCLPRAGGRSEKECLREILAHTARRAFRRPATEEEVERLVELARSALKEGDSFVDAVGLGLKAILVSPHFLFRVEVDQAPNDPEVVHRISDHELACRLSYFLWSSMPDDELFALAEKGRLHDEDVLQSQVFRMLDDPKSRAFVDNFAGQWLQTRFLAAMSPDPKLFPQFDEALRRSMETETLMFFDAVLREGRSILELIDADFTFVNERLARHYGIDGVEGEEFRRVSVKDVPRGGVLTQASVLTLTSNPTRTSPVKRGKWIMEQILGTPPLPPPPNVQELEETQEAILSGSLRERMEKHRKDPNCAICHNRMDALGFAFENFDALGAWREFEGNFLIDPSGELPGGAKFDGPDGLKAVLLKEEKAFCHAFAEKLLTYALGRGLEYYDKCALDSIVDFGAASGYKMKSLIAAVVKTEPFRMRRGGQTKQ